MFVKDINVMLDEGSKLKHARRVALGPNGKYAISVLTTRSSNSTPADGDAVARIYLGDGSAWITPTILNIGKLQANHSEGSTNHPFLLVVLEAVNSGINITCDLSINTF